MMILYTRTGCPFCEKVLDYAKENGVEFEVRDLVENPAFTEELVALGGKPQTPYLVDKEADVEMYESDDIIAYVDNKLNQG